MPTVDREILTRQIRDAVDIVDLIGGYVTLRRAGTTFKSLCPFHEEKTPSFTVHPAKQFFKCHGCGAGGDIFTFLQLREKVDFLEARRMLAERAGISLEPQARSSGGPGKTDLFRVNQWAQRVFRRNYQAPAGAAARKYVAERGILAEMEEAFGVGLAVDSFDSLIRQARQSRVPMELLLAAGLVKENPRGVYDVFRNRLMFPITDANARLLGFGGRTMGEDPAKYLNTPGTLLFDKSTNLFGLDRARDAMAKAGRAIVVEGYTDCIMAHQHGFTETVATLGTAMTDAHATLLRRQTDKVVLVFDSDQAGERAADRALSVSLLGGLDVTLGRVPHGKDPCDYLLSAGREGFSLVLNKALPALEFKWHLVVREYDASATGPGRRRAIEAYLLQLSEWLGQGAVDPIQTGLLVNQLSKILALPPEEVHRALQRQRRRSTKAGARPAAPPARPLTAGAEQEALKQIIEVLLNDPEQYPAVAAVFDPSAINDAALSAVAREMVAMITSDAFQLDELIGSFELPAFARLITDLQTRGERRGGYAAVVEGAVLCLESARQTRETTVLAGEIRTHRQHAQDPIPPGEDERLLALAASARNPHFSTPKARRRFLGL